MAYNPKVLLPFSYLGETDELRVQDASCLTALGERVSFWELQVLQEAHLCSSTQLTCMHVELVEENVQLSSCHEAACTDRESKTACPAPRPAARARQLLGAAAAAALDNVVCMHLISRDMSLDWMKFHPVPPNHASLERTAGAEEAPEAAAKLVSPTSMQTKA